MSSVKVGMREGCVRYSMDSCWIAISDGRSFCEASPAYYKAHLVQEPQPGHECPISVGEKNVFRKLVRCNPIQLFGFGVLDVFQEIEQNGLFDVFWRGGLNDRVMEFS